jgi:hypothetical protein
VIIHHRETTDGHRKDLRKLLKPVLEPLVGLGIVDVQLSPTVAGLIEVVDFRRGPSMLNSRRPATDVPR